MKMAKRILVGLLALAMLISCFAFAAIADSSQADEEQFSLAKYEQVLEYFTEPVLIDEDFSGFEVENSYDGVVNSTVSDCSSVVKSDDNGKYILVKSTLTGFKAKPMYFNFDADTVLDNFVVETVVSGAKNSLSIGVSESEQSGNVNMKAVSLVTMTFGTKFTYTTNVDGGVTGVALTAADGSDFAIESNGIYKIQLVYRGDLGTYSVTVTDVNDDTKTASASDIEIPTNVTEPAKIKNVQIGFAKKEIANSEFKVYSIKVLGGTAMRDEANKSADLDNAITELGKLINDASLSFDNKLDIVTIAGKIKTDGKYVSEKEEINALLNTLVNSGITLYSDKIDSYLSALTDSDPYSQRLQASADHKQFVNLIPDNYAEVLDSAKAEQVADVIKRYNAEVTFLENAKTDSEQLIAELADADTNSTDYAYLYGLYTKVKDLDPYAGYEGIDAAMTAYDYIVAQVNRIQDAVEKFLADVNVLADEEKDFTERYKAYLSSLETRLFKEDPKDASKLVESVVGVSSYTAEDGKTAEAIDKEYLESRKFMIEIINDCDTFISSVASANYAGYINAKEAMLYIAQSKMNNIHDEYAGIIEAKALYDTIRAYVNSTKAAAHAYINAVNALDDLSGDELAAAIANAMQLRESGNVLGVDGVAEANIKLTEISSASIIAEMAKDYFISLVEKACDENSATADLFSLIRQAVEAKAEASDAYSDVAAAKTELDNAITDYNALVNAFNDQFKTDSFIINASEEA